MLRNRVSVYSRLDIREKEKKKKKNAGRKRKVWNVGLVLSGGVMLENV